MDVWYNGKYGVKFYLYGGEADPVQDSLFIGHTWADWNLIPTARPFFVPPAQKKVEMDVKATNGKVDVSDLLSGYPLYENREGTWSFYVANYKKSDTIIGVDDGIESEIQDNVDRPILATILQTFPETYSRLLRALQGKKVAIVLDEDPDYYYRGRVSISQWESPNTDEPSTVTIAYDVFPYKIKIEETILDLTEDVSYTSAISYVTIPTLSVMPIVPSLRVNIINYQATSSVGVSFYNAELGGTLVENSSYGSGYTYDVKLLAKVLAQGRTISSCILSNVNGFNECRIGLNYYAIGSVGTVGSALLVYREGYL